MGASTFDELVSEGTLRAGVTGIPSRVGFQLKKWLRSQAQSFLWPQLKRELTGVALAVGIQKLTFGNGSSGVTEEIQRINDPIHLYDSGFSTMQDVRIQTDWGDAQLQVTNTMLNPVTNKGAPNQARVKANNTTTLKGRWDVIFNLAADKAYLLEISYNIIPLDPAGSDVPWYPNDRTVEQFVYYTALVHNKDPDAPNQLQLTAAMVAQDRMSEGMKPGIYDGGMKLDPKVFR